MEFNSELDRLQKYSLVERELERAKKLHPNFPTDIFQQLAIMQEEAGEVTKAVLDYKDGKCPLQHVKEELIQTAAMCMRMLEDVNLSIFTVFEEKTEVTKKMIDDLKSGKIKSNKIRVLCNFNSICVFKGKTKRCSYPKICEYQQITIKSKIV